MFATLTNANQVLEVIKGSDTFYVRENLDLGIGTITHKIKYAGMNPPIIDGLSPEELLRRQLLNETRGLTFVLATGEILARPYHKFKNFREDDEYQHLDFSEEHLILEKLDGSMVFPVVVNDSVYWLTKGGVTHISDMVHSFVPEYSDIHNFAYYCQKSNITPIFEYCSKDNKVVLDYDNKRMVLTAMRENTSGKYFEYENMIPFARNHGIVDVVRTGGAVTITDSEFAKEVYSRKGEEGFVIRFKTGKMCKFKTQWYLDIHSALEQVMFKKNVLRMIIEETIDDVKPFLTESVKAEIETFENNVVEFLLKTAKEVVSYASSNRGMEAQSFNDLITKEKGDHFRKYYMKAFRNEGVDENDIVVSIKKEIMLNVYNSVSLEKKSYLFGNFKYGDE